MVADDTKQRIDAMTIDEMAYEINRGHRSRFQRDNFAHLKTRYESRLREIESAQNSVANPPNHKPPRAEPPKSISLTKIAEASIAGVFAVFIIYLIWHYFGIQLFG